jgi:hypothetical protein
LRHVFGVSAAAEAAHAEDQQTRVKPTPKGAAIELLASAIAFAVVRLSDVVLLGHTGKLLNCCAASIQARACRQPH